MNSSPNNSKQIDLGAWIVEACKQTLDSKYVGLQLLIGLAMAVAYTVLSLTIIGLPLLIFPLLSGMFYFCKLRLQSKPAKFEHTLKGFDVLLEGLIAGALLCLGFIVLILLSILISCCFFLVLPAMCIFSIITFNFTAFIPGLLIDRKMKALDAFKYNYKICMENFWSLSVLGFIYCLIYLAGSAAFGIGLIIAIPLAEYFRTIIYREWIGFDSSDSLTTLAPVTVVSEETTDEETDKEKIDETDSDQG